MITVLILWIFFAAGYYLTPLRYARFPWYMKAVMWLWVLILVVKAFEYQG